MRTGLYGIRLFNDTSFRHGHHNYMKWKEGEREQENGETERESVREMACGREGR